MAVVSIQYTEGSKRKDLNYKSIVVSYGNLKKKKIFASGNFVKDWYNMTKFCILKLADTEYAIVHSSSVNHFFMDGAEYDYCYLDATGEKPKLVYADNWNENLELYVPKGTRPTWEELRELCGDTKKKVKKNRQKTTKKVKK